VRVLVAEDERSLAEQLHDALAAAGYAVDRAGDGPRTDFLARTETYDVVLLDLGLPGIDGLTLLRAWRESGLDVPVLVLTARGSWSERVLGIDSGADDYLPKPFRIEEVLARVRALIRRTHGHARPELRCGDVLLDPRLARVTVRGVPVALTSHEYRLLACLMHHDGRVVSRQELTEHIYAEQCDRDSNTLEVFVARVRRKLGAPVIETVRGLGYRMAAPGSAPAPATGPASGPASGA
jgi:two-component system OmpR family response regulator